MAFSDPALIIPDRLYSATGACWAPLGAAVGRAAGDLGTNAKTVPARPAAGRVGRAVTQRYALQETAAGVLPAWRVASCMRARIAGNVRVMAHPQHNSASYGGLQTCGSVWVCPVCSSKVAARRQIEIERGAANWRARGGGILLVTMTLRHKWADELGESLNTINGAHRWARGGRIWKRIKTDYGIVGAITTREITTGGNGWHPHLHALWFTEKPLSSEETEQLANVMNDRWITALERLGGSATTKHGFHLENINVNDDESFKTAIDYPVKQGAQWSATDEIIGGGRKQAKAGSMSIAELLRKAQKGSKLAAARFVEYAIATKGRNLVVWTPGLRELCGLNEPEQSDSNLAEEKEAGGQLVIELTPQQWQMVCYDRARGRLLAALQRGGRAELEHWCDVHGYPIEPWQWSRVAGEVP